MKMTSSLFNNLGTMASGGSSNIGFKSFNQGDCNTEKAGTLSAEEIHLNEFKLSNKEPLSPRTLKFFRDHKAKIEIQEQTNQIVIRGGQFSDKECSSFIKEIDDHDRMIKTKLNSLTNSYTPDPWRRDKKKGTYWLEIKADVKDQVQEAVKSLGVKPTVTKKKNSETYIIYFDHEDYLVSEVQTEINIGLNTSKEYVSNVVRDLIFAYADCAKKKKVGQPAPSNNVVSSAAIPAVKGCKM